MLQIDDNTVLKPESQAKLLGVTLDGKLNFNHQVSVICTKASRQLNVTARIFRFLSTTSRMIIYNSFFSAVGLCSSKNTSFRLSLCLSVRLSHLFHYVPIIVSSWNFQEWLPITEVMSMQKVNVRGHRSRSHRTKYHRSWPKFGVSGL